MSWYDNTWIEYIIMNIPFYLIILSLALMYYTTLEFMWCNVRFLIFSRNFDSFPNFTLHFLATRLNLVCLSGRWVGIALYWRRWPPPREWQFLFFPRAFIIYTMQCIQYIYAHYNNSVALFGRWRTHTQRYTCVRRAYTLCCARERIVRLGTVSEWV